MRAYAYNVVLTVELAALLVSGTALALPAKNEEEPEGLLQRIKARASEHLSQLPNYTCHQTLDRAMRTGPVFRHVDTVELEVAFIGNQELFSRSGEDTFGEQPIEKLVKGGTIGNAVLGAHVDFIFSQEGAEFRYAGTGKKDGRKTLRYDLRVPIEKSTFVVRHNGSAGAAGYEGKIWVDAETLDLVRVDFKVNRIPSHIGVRLVEKSLRYEKLMIGSSEFNLPNHSELAATDDMGNYSLNVTKLTRCREYGANSVVKFGAPTEGTASREKQ